MHLVYVIPGGSTNPDEAEHPTWYYPLHSEGTWSLAESTGSKATFQINFPLNWPLPFDLNLPDLHLSLSHSYTLLDKVL